MEAIGKSQLKQARAKSDDILEHGPVAVAARYRAGMILVTLNSGVEVRFPINLAQALEGRSSKELSDIQIEARGHGLHWPKLDVDLYLPNLLQGVLGTRKRMMAIGRLGGSATTPAKAKASAENGKLGGRPRKLR